MTGTWWWCLAHSRAEDGSSTCPPDQRMGPYQSREEAEHWRDKVEARNEKWDREDREWEGDDEA
jgi:hypothetical protein